MIVDMEEEGEARERGRRKRSWREDKKEGNLEERKEKAERSYTTPKIHDSLEKKCENTA